MIRAAVLALAVAGCTSAPPAAKVAPPTCAEPKECEVKWSAARDWVLSHAGYRIETETPTRIETFPSIGSSTALAVRVLKQAQADGTYHIAASIWCNNWIGCSTPPSEALADFARHVSSAWQYPAPK